MNVAELRAELARYDEAREVVFNFGGSQATVESVESKDMDYLVLDR